MKKLMCRSANLYLILDRGVNSYTQLLKIAKKAISAGVNIVQLRDKHGNPRDILDFSKKIVDITRGNALYIINDRVDLALASGADGVHLGQDDLSVSFARKVLGEKVIVGVSCQNLAHLKEAQDGRADYVGFGSVFKTLTKPERSPMDLTLLRKAVEESTIPVFAIGGINLKNISRLKELTGINRVAICRAICKARDVVRAVEAFKKGLRG